MDLGSQGRLQAAVALPAPKLPLQSRIRLFLSIWAFKTIVKVVFPVSRLISPPPPTTRPSFLKAYPVRPHLYNRVFIPRSHRKDERLPLYMDIHLGGFVMGVPIWDDSFCAHMANTHNIVVVSLDYSKAPLARYPVPSDDIVAIAQAVLSDDTLPIDKTRVVLGGFSAGGNLALSAAQAPELQGKIHGSVCWFSITDLVTSPADKLKSRPYCDAKQVDQLAAAAPGFSWAYIEPGQDLRDPRLSVIYAKRENLPKWLFVVGAEYDMLCNESKEMAMRLAGLGERERENGMYSFKRGTISWRMVRDVVHGFTHYIPAETDADKQVRLGRREEVIAEVGQWLLKGPFAKTTHEPES
ncbi:hypothetical protein LTR86_011225 [Recurvomyces mirabilis]|nr:hypothetical protein LTR86_011225 [Recurvomyces mirabilis]